LFVLLLLASAGAAIAELFPAPPDRVISIDFKAPGCPLASADNHGSAKFDGQVAPWNALDVLQGQPLQAVVTEVLKTEPLHDGAGDPTPVTFTLNTNSKELRAFKGAPTKGDEVRRDWVRLSLRAPRTDWVIQGLNPGEAYDLAFYGGLAAGVPKDPGEWKVGRMTARNDSQPDVVIERVAADNSGTIKGFFSGIIGSGWAGWSGLQIRGRFIDAARPVLAPRPTVLAAWSFEASPDPLVPDAVDPRVEVSKITSHAELILVQSRGGLPTSPVLITRPNSPRSNKANTAQRAVANGAYFEFKVTPKSNYTLNLVDLQLEVARGAGSGTRGFVIRSSVNDFAADLRSVTLPTPSTEKALTQIGSFQHESVKLSGAWFQGISNLNPITFRIYSYESTRVPKADVILDNIVVSGTILGEGQ
jgi:hypothetical protein